MTPVYHTTKAKTVQHGFRCISAARKAGLADHPELTVTFSQDCFNKLMTLQYYSHTEKTFHTLAHNER